jgi:hypothetical protein
VIRTWSVSLLILSLVCGAASAGPAVLAAKALEEAVEIAARTSGRPLMEAAARKTAAEALSREVALRGVKVVPMVEDGGLEMLRAIPRYGDELIEVASGASPLERRALAMDLPTLLPLTKAVGVEALEIEARAPGQAAAVFRIFGVEEGRQIARTVRTEDLPRLLKYGEKADNPETRRLLLKAYEKEGAGLFARIPPKLVLASGLTASMLVVGYRLPDVIGKWMDDHPMLVAGVMVLVMVVPPLFLIVLLLWRFGLMPWHRRRSEAKA